MTAEEKKEFKKWVSMLKDSNLEATYFDIQRRDKMIKQVMKKWTLTRKK